MKSLLWYQSAKLDDKDVLTYNGKVLEEGIERNNYFSKINKISDRVRKNKTPWCGKFENYFFFKGHLNAVDEIGRRMVFMFVSDEEDYESALNRELGVIGYELHKESKDCLLKYKKTRIKLFSVMIVILAVLLLLLITFINNLSGTLNAK